MVLKQAHSPKLVIIIFYWVELTTDGIKVGINGSTNVDVPSTSSWGFAPADGLALDFLFAPADNRPDGWDSVLKAISEPKTDPNTPMMEIDWIRIYTNKNYVQTDAEKVWANQLFY